MTGYQMTGNVMVLLMMTVQGWTTAAPVDANDSNIGAFYDQRQNGEYNIHVIVKDIDIVAFLGEGLGDYGDYDYSYDYHIPQKPWEASTTTQKTSSATPTAVAQNSSLSSSLSVTTPPSSVSPSEDAISTTLNPTSSSEGSTLSSRSSENTTVECLTPMKEPESIRQQEQETGIGSGTGRRRCSAGFVRDNHGRCRRLRRPGQRYTGVQLPFGLRLFPRPMTKLHPDNS